MRSPRSLIKEIILVDDASERGTVMLSVCLCFCLSVFVCLCVCVMPVNMILLYFCLSVCLCVVLQPVAITALYKSTYLLTYLRAYH